MHGRESEGMTQKHVYKVQPGCWMIEVGTNLINRQTHLGIDRQSVYVISS